MSPKLEMIGIIIMTGKCFLYLVDWWVSYLIIAETSAHVTRKITHMKYHTAEIDIPITESRIRMHMQKLLNQFHIGFCSACVVENIES